MFNSIVSCFRPVTSSADTAHASVRGANTRIQRKSGAAESPGLMQRLAAFLRRTFAAAPTSEQIRNELTTELQRPYSELNVRHLIALETKLARRAPRRHPAPALEVAHALADKSPAELSALACHWKPKTAGHAHPLLDAIRAEQQQRVVATSRADTQPQVALQASAELNTEANTALMNEVTHEVSTEASAELRAAVVIDTAPALASLAANKDAAPAAPRRRHAPQAPEAPIPRVPAQTAVADQPMTAAQAASTSTPVSALIRTTVPEVAPEPCVPVAELATTTAEPAISLAESSEPQSQQLLQQLLEQRTELFRYIFLGNISGVEPGRFNRNLQALRQAINVTQQQYSDSRAADDVTDETTLLMEIRDQAELVAKRQIIQESRSLDTPALAALAPAELDRMLNECVGERRLRHNVQSKFTQLITSCNHEHYRNQRIEVSAGGPQHSRLDCHGSHLLGYSVFMLLRELMPQSRAEGAYDGETSFELSKAELEALQRYLDARTAQVEQFSASLARLLAQDAVAAEDADMSPYVQLGQKPVTEAIVSTTAITARGIQHMSAEAPGVPVLLFSALSLNLTDYPDVDARVTIKSELTAMFVALGLRSQNKELKQFLRSDPYRANFSAQQLEQVKESMQQLAAVKDYVNEFLRKIGSTANFWQPQQWLDLFGGQMSSVMTEFELERLTPIIEQVVPGAQQRMREDIGGRMAAAAVQYRERTVHKLEHEMETTFAAQDLALINNTVSLQMGSFANSRSDTLAGVLLAGHTDVQFSPMAPQPDQLNDSDRDRLYTSTSVPPAYRNGQTMGPAILKGQILQLFAALKRSEAYQQAYAELTGAERAQAQTALATAVTQFEEFFLRKVDVGGNSYGGIPMIVTALGYFETYVATLANKARLGITDVSIATSFSALIAINTIDGGDTSSRCATGFAGRVVTLTEALAKGGAESLEHDLLQFRHECVQTAFDRAYANDSESSMAALQIPKLKKSVGLVPPAAGESAPSIAQAGVNPSLVQQFYHVYNPVSAYQRGYTFMSDRLRILLRDEDDLGLRQLVDELSGTSGNDDERRYDAFHENHDAAQPWSSGALKQLIDARLLPLLFERGMLMHNTTGTPLYSQDNAGEYWRTQLNAGSGSYRAPAFNGNVERYAYSNSVAAGSVAANSAYSAPTRTTSG